MALYAITAGAPAVTQDINQYRDLLRGLITDQNITLGFVGANSERATGGNMALILARGPMSTSSTGITWTSTSGGTLNQAIMFAPGSEDLIFGYDNGGAFVEQMRVKGSQAQGLWLTSMAAALPSNAGFAGGMRLNLYSNI